MTAKRPAQSLFVCALASAWMFTASGAGAADAAATTAGAQSARPAAATPAVDCSKSTLTGEQFMKMFHAIAMHGDLRDIPFIEKTLQVTLSHQYAEFGGKQDEHQIIYQTALPPTGPIWLILEVSDDDDGQNASNDVAVARFEFSPCVHITKPEFESYFVGGKPLAGSPNSNGHGASTSIELPMSAKTGGKARVAYEYAFARGLQYPYPLIRRPSIWQSKP